MSPTPMHTSANTKRESFLNSLFIPLFSVVCFASRNDLDRAIDKLQGEELNGRKIKLIDDSGSGGKDRSRSRSRGRRTRSKR